jgi:hypothetical protein
LAHKLSATLEFSCAHPLATFFSARRDARLYGRPEARRHGAMADAHAALCADKIEPQARLYARRIAKLPPWRTSF